MRSQAAPMSAEEDALTAAGVAFHQMLPSPDFGGDARVAIRLAEHLRDLGLASRVWVPAAGRTESEAASAGLRPSRFDGRRALGSSRLATLARNGELFYRLAGHGGDVVHVHCPIYYGALRRALRWARVRRVAHVQLDLTEETFSWAFSDPPELVVTCAEFLAGKVRRGLPARARGVTQVAAVPNAVDVSRFQGRRGEAAKRRMAAPADRPLILMLANLAPHKGQETAIRAVAGLKGRGIEAACWLVGEERDGTAYEGRLRRLASELGVTSDISFLGFRRDVAELLAAADVLLLPSTHEGLPLCLLEAQAARLPVIAAPTAGVPEIIEDGVTGLLAGAEDVPAYVKAIERIVRNGELRTAIVEAAYERVSTEHSWSRHLGRILSLYSDLFQSRCADTGRTVGRSKDH